MGVKFMRFLTGVKNEIKALKTLTEQEGKYDREEHSAI